MSQMLSLGKVLYCATIGGTGHTLSLVNLQAQAQAQEQAQASTGLQISNFLLSR